MMWSEAGQPDHLGFAGTRGGSKGGSTTTAVPTQQASSTSQSIPQWLSDAAQGAVQTGQGLAQRPYDPYTGQIVAGTPDATTQAYQQIANMQGGTTAANQAAANQWGGVLPQLQALDPSQYNQNTSALYGNFQQNVGNNAGNLYSQALRASTGLLGGYLQGSPLTAQQVGANAQQLMSPYTQSVMDPTNALMQQQLHQNLQNIGSAANQAGAFGGSRQGVQEGVAQSQAALGSEQYLGNLLNNQWGNALNTGYNVGALGSQQGYNAAAQLAQQNYGGAGALSNLMAGGYNTAAQQGANMAGTNLNLGINAAQQIPSLANAQQTQGLQMSGALQGVGTAQQAQQQQDLNAAMGQFYQGQDWPVQNLDMLLSSISGVPYNTTGSNYGYGQTTQTSNTGAGLLGGAASLVGVGNTLLNPTSGLFPKALGAIGL